MAKTTKDTTEERFQKIIDTAITKAEDVACPFGSFVNGLETMAHTLNERLSVARAELRSLDGD